MAGLFANNWIIGIGTSVIAGLILYFGFGIGRARKRKSMPYVEVRAATFFDIDESWVRFEYWVSNLGSGVAEHVKTYTQISIGNDPAFQSPISASSVIPPLQELHVRSEDPRGLVEACSLANMDYRYTFCVEYENQSGNKFLVTKSFFYHPKEKTLSTREEHVPKVIG